MGKKKFTFIDLFAGIGGMRMAFESVGGKCLFSSEWDKSAQKTYETNFGEIPAGDITKIDAKDIPDHDILLAGFPCQPFSLAGVSKKNSLGRKHGFADETQGTLFFDIARILKEKQPKVFVLENVKNLVNHDKGRTFSIIMRTLCDELGYTVYAKILDAKYWVPQHRERVFIVGFRKKTKFEFPSYPEKRPLLKDILDKEVPPKYILTDHLWAYLQNYAKKHREQGNGFGFGLVTPEDQARTLSARYHKDGSEILIKMETGNPRRLTPRECARLMGFPNSFKIVVADTPAYRQFGNSLVVALAKAVAKNVVKALEHYGEASEGELPIRPMGNPSGLCHFGKQTLIEAYS